MEEGGAGVVRGWGAMLISVGNWSLKCSQSLLIGGGRTGRGGDVRVSQSESEVSWHFLGEGGHNQYMSGNGGCRV